MFTCVATVQKVCIAYNNVLKEVLESLKKGLTFLRIIFQKCRPYILFLDVLPLCKKEAIPFAESVKSPCCEM